MRLHWLLGLVLLAVPAKAEEALVLEDLVRELKVALLKVEDAVEAAKDLPGLESATLEVNAVVSIDAKAGFSWWVVQLGASGGTEYATTIRLKLKPPPAGSPASVSEIDLADSLKEAILAGARAIKVARETNPPLLARSLETTIRFGVEGKAGGGFAIKFPPFEASASGEVAQSAVQSISVKYGLPAN